MQGIYCYKAPEEHMSGWISPSGMKCPLAGEQLIPVLHMQVVLLHGVYMTSATDNGKRSLSETRKKNFRPQCQFPEDGRRGALEEMFQRKQVGRGCRVRLDVTSSVCLEKW